MTTLLIFLYMLSFALASLKDEVSEGADDIIVFEKTQWDGIPAINVQPFELPVSTIVIKHTGGGSCENFSECSVKVKSLQTWMMEMNGSSDIWYNFLIGGDGNIYVGRGWDNQNEKSHDAIDICYIGNFLKGYDKPTRKMINAAQLLINKGLSLGKLSVDYMLVNHNQTAATLSPGQTIYKEIVNLPHYHQGRMY